MGNKNRDVVEIPRPVEKPDVERVMPTFILRPDRMGHLQTLVQALPLLQSEDRMEAERVLREFELWLHQPMARG